MKININLDDLIGTLEPDPVSIAIGGSTFVVNDLSVGEIQKIAGFAANTKDDADIKEMVSYIDFLGSCFKGGRMPPQLNALKKSITTGSKESFGRRQNLINQVVLINSAIAAGMQEVVSPKKLMQAEDKIRQQLKDQAQSDSSSD